MGSTILSVILTGRTGAALAHVHAATPHMRELLASIRGFHDVYLVAAAISLAGGLAAFLLRRGAPPDEGGRKETRASPITDRRSAAEGRAP